MQDSGSIAILMATMLEAKPFVEGMSLKRIEKKPFALYANEYTRLIISGVGKSNAAMAAAYYCLNFNPACVCNLGAAGATHPSYPLGKIFHITEICEYDRPDFRSGKPHIHIPHALKGFETEKLATGDKAVIAPDERKKISVIAGLVDMEGAAVVQACKKFQTKGILFKFVSDTPDHTHDEDIVANIRLYRTPFYTFFANDVLPVLLG
jgi:adenosylhomocysteine nucleosidase